MRRATVSSSAGLASVPAGGRWGATGIGARRHRRGASYPQRPTRRSAGCRPARRPRGRGPSTWPAPTGCRLMRGRKTSCAASSARRAAPGRRRRPVWWSAGRTAMGRSCWRSSCTGCWCSVSRCCTRRTRSRPSATPSDGCGRSYRPTTVQPRACVVTRRESAPSTWSWSAAPGTRSPPAPRRLVGVWRSTGWWSMRLRVCLPRRSARSPRPCSPGRTPSLCTSVLPPVSCTTRESFAAIRRSAHDGLNPRLAWRRPRAGRAAQGTWTPLVPPDRLTYAVPNDATSNLAVGPGG